MGEDRGVLSEDEARIARFIEACVLISTRQGNFPESVVEDAMALTELEEIPGLPHMRAMAVFNAAIQRDDFIAKRIAPQYKTIRNMVALVEALRLQVVIERME